MGDNIVVLIRRCDSVELIDADEEKMRDGGSREQTVNNMVKHTRIQTPTEVLVHSEHVDLC